MALALAVLLAAIGSAPCRAEPPSTVRARVVAWDVGFRPPTLAAWIERLVDETRDAADSGARVLVFPELFAWGLAPYQPAGTGPAPAFITRTWRESVLPAVGKVLAGRGVLAVLGTYPHQDSGADHVLNRASIWRDEGWSFADKLDPTPAEIADTPPVRPGEVLSVFPFLGGKAAVLVCFSSEMPEVAARLKAEGVQLVLIPSDTEDEAGARRILRSASARAVELGAAVLVSPLTGRQGDWSSVGSSALFLPSQKGIADPERVGPRWSSGIRRADYGIPWAGILSLRARPPRDVEARPFLSPASPFQVRSEPAPVIP